MTDDERIIFLRNQLTLWALGNCWLRLSTVEQYILELDKLLQNRDL